MTTNYIQHKRTSVPGKIPLASDLEVGEIAINFPDKIIYTKTGYDEIIAISTVGLDSEIQARLDADSDLLTEVQVLRNADSDNKALLTSEIDSEVRLLENADSDIIAITDNILEELENVTIKYLVNIEDVVGTAEDKIVADPVRGVGGFYTKVDGGLVLDELPGDFWNLKPYTTQAHEAYQAFYYINDSETKTLMPAEGGGWKFLNIDVRTLNQASNPKTYIVWDQVGSIGDKNDLNTSGNPEGRLYNPSFGTGRFYERTITSVEDGQILVFRDEDQKWHAEDFQASNNDSELRREIDSDIQNIKLNNLADVTDSDLGHMKVPAWDSDTQIYRLISLDMILNNTPSFDAGAY